MKRYNLSHLSSDHISRENVVMRKKKKHHDKMQTGMIIMIAVFGALGGLLLLFLLCSGQNGQTEKVTVSPIRRSQVSGLGGRYASDGWYGNPGASLGGQRVRVVRPQPAYYGQANHDNFFGGHPYMMRMGGVSPYGIRFPV